MVREYCEVFPDVPNRTLARKLLADHPGLYPNLNAARTAVQFQRGNMGRRSRQLAGRKPAIRQEETSTARGTDNELVCEGKSKVRITSLDQLLAFFQVDRHEWLVDSWQCTAWESMHKDDANQAVVTPLYRVFARFKRCRPMMDARREVEAFKEAARRFAPPTIKPGRKHCSDGVLLELAIPDLHHGKLAWGEETGGADYDSKISERTFMQAVQGLADGAAGLKVSRVLLPIGNDFLNVDNHLSQTTAGTPQDEDTRWQKSFRTARQMVVNAIGMLAQIAPVDVVIVPGNHDEERIFYLGDALECFFHRQKFVTVNNAPTQRKYVRWGKCLIGFTHGKYEKHAELPNSMALERPADWAETLHREWHLGHFHHLRNRIFEPDVDARGVMTRFLPSLCPPDAWHSKSGHISAQRQALGMAFAPGSGLVRLWPWRVG